MTSKQDAADAAAENEVNEFCQRCIGSSSTWIRILDVSSHAEVPHSYLSARHYDLKCDTQDADVLYYSTKQLAFPYGQRVPVEYSGRVYRMDTRGLDAGYTKLREENNYINLPRSLTGYCAADSRFSATHAIGGRNLSAVHKKIRSTTQSKNHDFIRRRDVRDSFFQFPASTYQDSGEIKPSW